jgi:hypothetical protein
MAAPVVVLTPNEAKGLEFDNVVVVEPGAIADGDERGLQALFVALTRCTQRLALVHAGPLPPELGLVPSAPAEDPPGAAARAADRVIPAGPVDNPGVAGPTHDPVVAGPTDQPVTRIGDRVNGATHAEQPARPADAATSPVGPASSGSRSGNGAHPPTGDAGPPAELAGLTAGVVATAVPGGMTAGAVEREVARAVAAALVRYTTLCVQPELVPLVIEEMQRWVAPAAPPSPVVAGPAS